ncbi:MAG: serine/threonine-protein kinase [Planctomycetota bacterium]
MARQEDFVFAERVLQHGYATEEQVQECLTLLDRLRAEMQLDESLRNLMVKKGYLAIAQASVLDIEVDPNRADRPRNAIEGYRLIERLGSGAMGSVYKALHVKLDIPVALKVLRPSLASSKTQIERLKREARLAARLSHPNVVRCLDVGESNGFHYLTMEFVEGSTVRDLLAKGRVPEKEALAIVKQVAAGLEHAHGHGVVHRDVKPGNIMLTADGTAKLGDFGLARGQAPSDLTLEHASIGTPQYVAPEQMRRGSDATARSDLFSLGATLYHMVTGRPPFDGENLGEIVQNVLACQFQPAETLVPGLSRDTVYLIDRLLRANPRERHASAAGLIADLEGIDRGERVAPPDFVGDYQAFLRKRRRRRYAILAGCAAVLVGAAVLYRGHRVAEREKSDLRKRCVAAADTGADAVAAKTLDALGKAIAAMEKAEGGAGGCDVAVIEPLRKRIGLFKGAARDLDAAEKALVAADHSGAEYSKLHAGLAGPPTGLADVDLRIEWIRTEIRRLSKDDANERHGRLAFRDAEEVMREARAFARDLKERYLGLDEPWTDGVEQAPTFLDAFDEEWARLDKDRGLFDGALAKGDYVVASARLKSLRADEEKAKNALLRNPYLANFSDSFVARDERTRSLRDKEMEEWREKILPAATREMQATPPRPDEAERQLTDFLRRADATRDLVLGELDRATRQRESLVREQEASYASIDALFRYLLSRRAYAKANEDVAKAASSARWLDGPDKKYLALGERAKAVAALRGRFLEGTRRQKTVPILGKGIEVPGKDIEAAPGDNRDLFVARRGREPIEFTLADLSLDVLERIFAFKEAVEEDKLLSGWFHAAEAFRADENPYAARKLRQAAQKELRPGDPWLPAVDVALAETEERIREGEKRAAQAAGELKAATDAGETMKALSLCRELVLVLGWTEFCKHKLPQYRAELERFERISKQQLLPVELGVPESQVKYDKDGNPTITFTGRTWLVTAGPEAETRTFWEDWFRTKGIKDNEILDQDLVARAMTQRLAWRGDVEVGPEGGYRPGKLAIIGDVGKEWATGNPSRPVPLLLHFPFLPDQPWKIEIEVRWPTPEPGYFALACGQIQAVVGFYRGPEIPGFPEQAATGGGMKGACLVESDAMDPAALGKQIEDLQWYLVDVLPEEMKNRRRLTKDKAYLDDFAKGKPYGMRLERTRDSLIFEMWPLGAEKPTVHLVKRFPDARKLDKLVTLDDGRTVFRFFGAPPGEGLAYELHDVRITGSLSEKRTDVD